jgi:hypothetical protein
MTFELVLEATKGGEEMYRFFSLSFNLPLTPPRLFLFYKYALEQKAGLAIATSKYYTPPLTPQS